MANMRIHELAKEINVSNKEIIGILKNNKRENLTHMSSVSDSEIGLVKKTFKKNDGMKQQESVKYEKKVMDKPTEKDRIIKEEHTSEIKTSENAKNNTVKRTEDTNAGKNVDEVKKSSHITQVYNPQNSSRGRDNQGNNYRRNNNGGQNGYRNSGSSQNQNGYRRDNNNSSSNYGNNNGTTHSNQGNYRQTNNSEQGGNGYQRNNSEQNGNGYQRNNYNQNNNGNQGGYRSNNGNQGGYRSNNGGQGGYRSNNGNQGNYQSNNNGNQGNYQRNNYSQGNRYNQDNSGNQTGGNHQNNNSGQGGYRSYGNNSGQGNQNGQRNSRPNNNYGARPGQRNDQQQRNNQQGNYRNNNGGNQQNGGYRGGNNSGQGNYRNNNGGNQQNGGYNNRGGYNSGQGNYRNSQNNRNDGHKETTGDDFVLQTKPESRRADYKRNDKVVKKTQKDNEHKENLKFVNTGKRNTVPQKPVEKEDTIKTLILPDVLTIKELADKMKVVPSVLVKKLFLQGKVVTINQEIEYDLAEEIALEFNCICEHEVKIDVIAELLKEEEEDPSALVSRPPVVCVMGHVDHGKTSLLDTIRSTRVTAREAGGITQHIGAYMVEINDQKITFLDTPGHEAFTAMRMRGAQATDIAILVVAADDGVMPQTIEAINHAKAAEIDIIVAINKIDKPNANIERVKQELTEYELIPEEWGGDTIFVPVSAHTKEGIDTLLEMILLTAEMRELKANPDRKARGVVIEAKLDKGKGPVASILVQKGVLKVGDNIAAGPCYGKIRAMTDDKGFNVKQAGPSTPVEILGLNDVPNAGEIFVSTDNEKEARAFAETFIREGREKLLDDTKAKLSLDDLFNQIQAGNVKELGIIIKADVQGSVEAIKQSLVKLSNEEVAVKIIHGGVGNINESDVILASASNAIIIGFNVKPDNQARLVADREKVDLRLYKVIYNAIEDVTAALKGMLEPTYEEKVMGHAEIRQIFKASGIGNIAGAYVLDGKITKSAKIRINRAGEQIFEGPLASLKRFKDEVKEVKEGYECGLVFEKFNDIKEEDVVEAYEMVEVPR